MNPIKYIINGFICEIIGIYLTLRCTQFVSGHDYIGENAYGELKCKRCGYVSKGDPRLRRNDEKANI